MNVVGAAPCPDLPRRGWVPSRRDGTTALLLFAGGTLAVMVGLYSHWPAWQPSRSVRLLPSAAVTAALAYSRTVPVPALAVGTAGILTDVLLGPSVPGVLVWTYVLYTVTVHCSARLARGLLVAGVVTTAATAVTVTACLPSAQHLVATLVYASLVTVWPVVAGFSVREHRERALAERARAAQTARLAEVDHAAAVSAERARMARELHDVVANHLSAVAVQSAAALAQRSPDVAQLRETLALVRESSAQGLAEMRRMIGLLRADVPADASADRLPPRLDQVDELLARARRSGLDAVLEMVGPARPLPTPVDLAAYRILQESLTNALKHASPCGVRVTLVYQPDRVVITAENQLERVGVSRLPGSGAGLVGMRERAVLLGGTFEAGAVRRPGGGAQAGGASNDSGASAALPLVAATSDGREGDQHGDRDGDGADDGDGGWVWRLRAELPSADPVPGQRRIPLQHPSRRGR